MFCTSLKYLVRYSTVMGYRNAMIVLKTFNSQFQDIKVWFTDQNSQPLKIGDNKFNCGNEIIQSL